MDSSDGQTVDQNRTDTTPEGLSRPLMTSTPRSVDMTSLLSAVVGSGTGAGAGAGAGAVAIAGAVAGAGVGAVAIAGAGAVAGLSLYRGSTVGLQLTPERVNAYLERSSGGLLARDEVEAKDDQIIGAIVRTVVRSTVRIVQIISLD